MVLGESQILGQVQTAHERAQEDHVAGPVLGEVFHTAIRVGRRARAETKIAQKPVSVSSEAVRLAEKIGGPLDERRILIVGSGKMGRLGGRVLRDKGVRDITVVNRTAAHAESLAAEWDARALGWHHLAAAIREADIVFTSTSAPHAVITTELVRSAHGPAGRTRPLLLLDLAVPRDVEESVHDLPNVQVIDIDEIKHRLEGNLARRQSEVPAVEAILDEEVQRFEDWRWQQAELRPLMTAMRSRTDEIRRRELDRMMRKMGDISPEVRLHLEKFSRSLVNKVLHEPTRRLKEETDPTRCSTYAKVTRELFGLPADERMRAAGGM
jgi:glutamyl-tRNA reductase